MHTNALGGHLSAHMHMWSPLRANSWEGSICVSDHRHTYMCVWSVEPYEEVGNPWEDVMSAHTLSLTRRSGILGRSWVHTHWALRGQESLGGGHECTHIEPYEVRNPWEEVGNPWEEVRNAHEFLRRSPVRVTWVHGASSQVQLLRRDYSCVGVCVCVCVCVCAFVYAVKCGHGHVSSSSNRGPTYNRGHPQLTFHYFLLYWCCTITTRRHPRAGKWPILSKSPFARLYTAIVVPRFATMWHMTISPPHTRFLRRPRFNDTLRMTSEA